MTRVLPSTLRDVAEAAGVHPATASRALNPATRGLVNADTARRVIKVAESLGYRPNPIARGLKTAKSGSIGLVIPDLTNPLFPPIVRGIEEVLDAAGYSGLVVNTDNDPVRERTQIESLRSRQVEGLIVATALLDHPLLEQLHREGVPMVMVNRRPDGARRLVDHADDATGMRLAVDHLASLGHRRIAHLAGPDDDLDRRDPGPRVPGGGARPRPRRRPGAGSLVQLLERGRRRRGAARPARQVAPTSPRVVAGNDLIALGCYDVFAERGIACPDDISVVGFNDMPFLDKLRPPLTTIAIPHHQIGAEAARLLLDAIAEPGPAGALGAAAGVARRPRLDRAAALKGYCKRLQSVARFSAMPSDRHR